jgi:predicted  nucleic acid-binding Zn-ribbon protein
MNEEERALHAEIHRLNSGREMEQEALRNAIPRILALEAEVEWLRAGVAEALGEIPRHVIEPVDDARDILIALLDNRPGEATS